MNPEQNQPDITIADLDPIDQVMYYLSRAIDAMRKAKPAEPGDLARYCQIVITDAQKVRGLWDSLVCRYMPEDEPAAVFDFATVRERNQKAWAIEAMGFIEDTPVIPQVAPKPSVTEAFAEMRKMVRGTPGMEQGLTEVLAEREGDWAPDWAQVPDGFKWVAVDADGEVWAYTNEPQMYDEDIWNMGRELPIDVEPEPSRQLEMAVDMTGKPVNWWRIAKWRRPQ